MKEQGNPQKGKGHGDPNKQENENELKAALVQEFEVPIYADDEAPRPIHSLPFVFRTMGPPRTLKVWTRTIIHDLDLGGSLLFPSTNDASQLERDRCREKRERERRKTRQRER